MKDFFLRLAWSLLAAMFAVPLWLIAVPTDPCGPVIVTVAVGGSVLTIMECSPKSK